METSLYITRYNSDNVTLNNNYNANKNNNDKRQQLQKQVTSVSLEIKVDVTIFEAAIPDLFFFLCISRINQMHAGKINEVCHGYGNYKKKLDYLAFPIVFYSSCKWRVEISFTMLIYDNL